MAVFEPKAWPCALDFGTEGTQGGERMIRSNEEETRTTKVWKVLVEKTWKAMCTIE